MRDNFKNIKTIVESWYVTEADQEEENSEKKIIEIFYKDLDMEGKQKVLEAIDATYEYVDVFSDDIVRDNIEEELSKKPIMTITAEELINKMDIEL